MLFDKRDDIMGIVIKKPGTKLAGKGFAWQRRAGGGATLRPASLVDEDLFINAAGIPVGKRRNGVAILEDKSVLERRKANASQRFDIKINAVKKIYLEFLDTLTIDPKGYEFVDDLTKDLTTKLFKENSIVDLLKKFKAEELERVMKLLVTATFLYLKREFPRLKVRPRDE